MESNLIKQSLIKNKNKKVLCMQLKNTSRYNTVFFHYFSIKVNRVFKDISTYFCSHLLFPLLFLLMPFIYWSEITKFKLLNYMIFSKSHSPIIHEVLYKSRFGCIVCIFHYCKHCCNLHIERTRRSGNIQYVY